MEPSDLIALAICLAFSAYMVKCIVEGMSNPEEHRFSDSFDIGYTSCEHTSSIPVDVEIKAVKEKLEISPEQASVREDCVKALHSLGHNKTDAKAQVADFFKDNKADSVEDFLAQFMAKSREGKNV